MRHNIAQMTSTRETYIPCLLVIIMAHDHMKQASTPLWWSLRATRKIMTIGLNREGTKQKYT